MKILYIFLKKENKEKIKLHTSGNDILTDWVWRKVLEMRDMYLVHAGKAPSATSAEVTTLLNAMFQILHRNRLFYEVFRFMCTETIMTKRGLLLNRPELLLFPRVAP